MSSQMCSEARAFFILDSLSPGALVWTKKALTRLGSTLAVCLKQPCPLGIAAMHRSKAGPATQLQILLRLGTAFHVREFISCIKRLPDPGPAMTATDGNMMGSALMALLGHMQKQPARPGCHNHLFILSSSFAACAHNTKMLKVMQLVCLQQDCSLHFVQLTGPEADLAREGHDAAEEALQEPGAGLRTAPAAGAGTDGFQDMVSGLGVQDCVTYSSFVADGETVTDLLCQSWLRELLASAHYSTSAACPPSSSTAATAVVPDMLLHFGHEALPCDIQQHILHLDPWLLPAHLCPCHSLPMQPQDGSSTAAAHTQASCTSSSPAAAAAAASTATAASRDAADAAAGDAGSLAALLVLPEAAPWMCSITGQPVPLPLSACRTDDTVLQLGRHSQLCLRAPGTTAHAGGSSSAGSSAQQYGVGAWNAGGLSIPRALPLPAGQPAELHVKHVVQLADIDSMLIYGMPLLLCPSARTGSGQRSSNGSTEGVGHSCANAAGGTAPPQPQQQSSSEAPMLMRALCQMLLEQQQVLVACSHTDLLRRCSLPLLQWFMLQPAADGSCLLLRRLACREQLLPPRGLAGIAAAAAAAAGSNGQGGLDDGQVVLLDAEQLESVRSSLACLQHSAGASTHPFSSKDATDATTADDPAGLPAGEDQGGAAAAAVGELGEAGSLGQGAGAQQLRKLRQPLLLSCGLDAWMTSVLEATSATYCAPALAAAPQAPATASAAAAAAVAGGLRPLPAAAAGRGGAPVLPHHAVPGALQAAGTAAQGGIVHGPAAVGGGASMPFGASGSWPAGAPASGSTSQMMQAPPQMQHRVAGVMPGSGGVAGGDVDDAGGASAQHGQAGGAAAGGGGGPGRAARGRRNSNSNAVSGRKLRLSKV